tara:strand:- start:425 stop:1393 length:969 start_codon:yes stop_codon:yes gene_type:complete
MATVTKAVLKTYFEQGDIPTQGQYVDLIDSQFGLGETGTQIIQGTISASSAEVEYLSMKKQYLPGNGIDSMKVGSTFTVGKTLEISGSVRVQEGGISASGDFIITNITASGTISASGDVIASFITSSGGITSSAGITASSAHFSGPITSSGISSSGTLYASAGDFGDGNITNVGSISLDQILPDDGTNVLIGNTDLTNEIKLNGPTTASGNISSSGLLTVDTLTIGATYNNTNVSFVDNAFTNNNKAFSITTTLPDIDVGNYCEDTTVTNSSVTTNSVIIASAKGKVSVVCFDIGAGSFKFTATGLGEKFYSTAVRINFIVL